MDTHDEATLPSSRQDRTRQRQDAGAEGNARLTAMTAALLLVLLAVEGLTIIRIGSLLKLHVFLGAMLIPPVAVKLTSTLYRFFGYYANAPAYRRKGPPHTVLRFLGPLLVVVTVVLFATGVALLFVGVQDRNTWLFWHRASFILWFAVMVVHVLGHIVDVGRVGPRDFRSRTRQRGCSGLLRQATLLGALAAGSIVGAALLSRAGHYA